MTRTELRLADALDAAAQGLREDTLRPLLVPQRMRRRAAWTAPVAAAAGLLLVVGVAVAVAGRLPGSGHISSSAPPRYYVESDGHGDRPVVRSTTTGTVTDTVQVPRLGSPLGPYLVTAAANGLFFTVVPAATGARIYRFRVTAAGQVSSLHALPGGPLPGSQLAPKAVAASPDGSRVAVALTPNGIGSSAGCSAPGRCTVPVSIGENDQIDLVSAATGATSVWQGGIAQNYSFSVVSLSWTGNGNGNELVYYGEWCPQGSSSTQGGTATATIAACTPGAGGGEKAEVWALDPASDGGQLTHGHRLFSMSAEYSNVPQVLISPDGTTLTAVALTGPVNGAGTPRDLAVERISLATQKRTGVLYSENLGRTATLKGKPAYLYSITLSADAAGQHWMLGSGFCNTDDLCQGGFFGYIDGGRLVPLPAVPGSVASEAW